MKVAAAGARSHLPLSASETIVYDSRATQFPGNAATSLDVLRRKEETGILLLRDYITILYILQRRFYSAEFESKKREALSRLHSTRLRSPLWRS